MRDAHRAQRIGGGDDNRRMTDVAPPASAASAPANPLVPGTHAGASVEADSGVRLTDWGLIRARGADAATFLQGQLTADVSALSTSQATLAGYCSAKGRLLASFVVWRPQADEFLLACSADLLVPTLKRLQMFVLRAKCSLTDITQDRPLWGHVAPDDGQPAWSVAASEGSSAVRLPSVDGFARWLRAAPASTPPTDGHNGGSAALWSWLEVRSGIVRIVSATADQFVPQMVNFELVGGVNFKKGCYPGQEVVARSQYRGTVKRRALLFQLPPGVRCAAGQEVFHDSDPAQPAGLVALAAMPDAEAAVSAPARGACALVEVKLALASIPGAAGALGAFHVGAADGPALTPVPLPYALPSGEDA